MAGDRALLRQALSKGERTDGRVEFKERLSREVHLSEARFESLAAQLRHRVLSGDGEATYVVGVTDEGHVAGIPPGDFSESMEVLNLIAEEAGAHLESVETWGTNDGIVGVASVKDGGSLEIATDHLIVGTAGHVDHGKSTLVGSLVTGRPDDGEGGMRSYLDVKPHEVERGLSADLSYGVYGFDDEGPVRVDKPDRKSDRATVVESADRVVSFVDTVGHEPWLSTTIRGLLGQKLDYGLLKGAAHDGPTETTREHLGVLLATDLPTIVAITKTDLVPESEVEAAQRDVERLLRQAGRSPLSIARHGVEAALEEIGDGVVPIVRTSAVTMDGLSTLDTLFSQLPKTAAAGGEFRMYIDRTYRITGVGAVASGTIESGTVAAGDELLVGPVTDGTFKSVEVRSIEMHYHRVDRAEAGRIVGIALKGIDEADLERGMALVPHSTDPTPTRRFEAEVMVLNHPTRIHTGYEPVVHLETVSEAARFEPLDGQLLPGDTGETEVEFKFNPYLIEPGQRFVFREGRSKGVGTVTKRID